VTLGYSRPISLLAFDHRGSFQHKLLGIEGTPTAADDARISEAKALIFAGFRRALESGAVGEGAGILVDEQFGAEIAGQARELGVVVAMPVEQSDQAEFVFAYGERFGEHVDAFGPTFAKVLVRYNPAGDAALNGRQTARLAQLADWLHANGHRFLFELLVPAEAHQLASVGGDADRYDRELRPGLMIAAIRELQAAGVEPDVWKIEGLDSREDCALISEAARSDGRDGVGCIVLGRAGTEQRVVEWLQNAAGVPGWIGFAVGRTIWWDAVQRWLAGGPVEEAIDEIAGIYGRLNAAYASEGARR
jgi:myo-inositol catabolism protein IolC